MWIIERKSSFKSKMMEFAVLIGAQLLGGVLCSDGFDEFADVPDASSGAVVDALNVPESSASKISVQDMVNQFIQEFPEKL